MLACRSIFRVENFTNIYQNQISKAALYFQRCYIHHGVKSNWKMGGGKTNERNRKRQKPVATVWRPVSMQSCSIDAKNVNAENSSDLADGVKLDVGIQVVEVHESSSGCVTEGQPSHGDPEKIIEVAEQNISPTTLAENDEGQVLCRSVPSTEKHSISMEVGSSLFRFIRGKGGSTQENIERELGIRIIFPSSKKDESIIIEGISPDTVARASERIQLIIDEAVKSSALDYSHFISLPLAIHPELVDKLINFQNSLLGTNDSDQYEVLDSDSNRDTTDKENGEQTSDKAPQVAVKLEAQEDNGDVKVDTSSIPLVSYPPKASTSSTSKAKTDAVSELGIDKSIFIKPKTFHLTVLMLKLWNKERVDAAAGILQSVAAEVMDALDGRPVYIRLKGLECMRGSFAKARVLYAPVEEVGGEDRLMQACKVIIDAFIKGGLVFEKDARQVLKLHATVMNARHRKRKKGTKRFDTFDARGIVKQYGSEEWGEYLIREVHLSQRFVFEENGYYRCCASIPFPENMCVD